MMRLLLTNWEGWGLKKICRVPKFSFTESKKYISKYVTAANPAECESELFKEGECVEGFIVKKTYDVPDLLIKCVELKHLNTYARYLHFQREDTNNVFGIGFRTIPSDSTGVAHVLEHLALCGSEKYPCRDTFMKMLNRSQSTYMNAFTFFDYTFYPFSTINYSDYRNLMSVYLDAVFQPKLRYLDFLQEAWRMEHEVVDDPKTPIIFKGVVFNEMKGAFSNTSSVFSNDVMHNLLPSHTYRVEHGGDPIKIPTLTFENMKKFYSDYYHPSNARFYSYGNFSLRRNLQFINEEYLDKLGKVDSNCSEKSKVPSEPKWLEPRRIHMYCRKDGMADPEKQSYIAISHACCDVTDIQECFVLEVISYLLMDGPNSALYKHLVEPGIASGFSPGTGYNNTTKTTAMTVSLQGINEKDFNWAVDTFDKSIKQVIENEFDQKQLEGILHNIELGMKHQTSNFGMVLLGAVNPVWNHGGNIKALLNINKMLTTLRNDMSSDPEYLQKKVEQYLKNNTHRLILTMSPHSKYESCIRQVESELLKKKLENMEENEIEDIFSTGLSLKEFQEQKEDVSVLPTLTMADINKEIERVDLKNTTMAGVPVQMTVQPTNGLVYLYGVINAHHLSDECKLLLPLFCYVATSMGTKSKNFREIDLLIKSVSESFNFNHNIIENLSTFETFEESIMFSSFCLNRNLEAMLNLWLELLHNTAFDQADRFKTLVTILATNSLNEISNNGNHYAMTLSSSLLGTTYQRIESSSGLTYIKKLQEISSNEPPEKSLQVLKKIADELLNKERLKTALNFSPGDEDSVSKHHSSFCETLKGTFKGTDYETTNTIDADTSNKGIHHNFAFQVGFAAKSSVTVPFLHKDFASVKVLSQLLTHKYLMPVIRERGGAYGAGCGVSNGGILNFFSYRDPKPVQSLDVFDQSLTWLMKKEFTKSDIQEAKLGVFKEIDSPVPPGSKGISAFLSGLTDEKLQTYRTLLINLSDEDVVRAGEKYLDSNLQQGRALIGPLNEDVLKRKNESWEIIE